MCKKLCEKQHSLKHHLHLNDALLCNGSRMIARQTSPIVAERVLRSYWGQQIFVFLVLSRSAAFCVSRSIAVSGYSRLRSYLANYCNGRERVKVFPSLCIHINQCGDIERRGSLSNTGVERFKPPALSRPKEDIMFPEQNVWHFFYLQVLLLLHRSS